MNLNPIIEYIDNLTEGHGHENFEELIIKRNHFGKLPLELGQFIPCLNGKPLEKPECFEKYILSHKLHMHPSWYTQCEEYETALSKVLFEGWKVVEGTDTIQNGNIFIRFMKDNTTDCTGYDPKITRFYVTSKTIIEDIAHLNLILTKEGKKKLI